MQGGREFQTSVSYTARHCIKKYYGTTSTWMLLAQEITQLMGWGSPGYATLGFRRENKLRKKLGGGKMGTQGKEPSTELAMASPETRPFAWPCGLTLGDQGTVCVKKERQDNDNVSLSLLSQWSLDLFLHPSGLCCPQIQVGQGWMGSIKTSTMKVLLKLNFLAKKAKWCSSLKMWQWWW